MWRAGVIESRDTPLGGTTSFLSTNFNDAHQGDGPGGVHQPGIMSLVTNRRSQSKKCGAVTAILWFRELGQVAGVLIRWCNKLLYFGLSARPSARPEIGVE
jgi:hypothetical protein